MSLELDGLRSRVVADKTRYCIVISDSDKYKIAFIKCKKEAQIPAAAAFVISAERTDANAGMQVRPAKSLRQTRNGGVHERLLNRRQPPECALVGRAYKDHGCQGLSLPVRRSCFISDMTFR